MSVYINVIQPRSLRYGKTDFTADLAFEIEGTSQTTHCRDIQAILFDLDGTLIATRQLYVAAYAEALAPHFGKHLTEAEIMALSPRAEIEFLSSLVPAPQTASCIESFYANYEAMHITHFRGIYEGVLEMLDAVNELGFHDRSNRDSRWRKDRAIDAPLMFHMRAMRLVAMAAALCVSVLSGAVAQTPVEPRMVAIEGGAYPIGSADGHESARPQHTVTLESFLIDAYEVTNGQFAVFLNSLEVKANRDVRAGELRPGDVEGRDAGRLRRGGSIRAFIDMDDTDARIGIIGGQFVPEPGFADHPAPESTWRGAKAFCAWRGSRLPTEVEWEAAARGREGRTYPWGETAPTRERAVFARGRGETDPVGSHPQGATAAGVFDLSGNEAEWTSSLFKPYPYDASDGREDPNAAGQRVTRGGDHVFDVAADQLTGYFRQGFSRDPRAGHRHIGFRCAKNAV